MAEKRIIRDVPQSDQQKQKDIAERAGEHDPAIEMAKQQGEKDPKHDSK